MYRSHRAPLGPPVVVANADAAVGEIVRPDPCGARVLEDIRRGADRSAIGVVHGGRSLAHPVHGRRQRQAYLNGSARFAPLHNRVSPEEHGAQRAAHPQCRPGSPTLTRPSTPARPPACVSLRAAVPLLGTITCRAPGSTASATDAWPGGCAVPRPSTRRAAPDHRPFR